MAMAFSCHTSCELYGRHAGNFVGEKPRRGRQAGHDSICVLARTTSGAAARDGREGRSELSLLAPALRNVSPIGDHTQLRGNRCLGAVPPSL